MLKRDAAILVFVALALQAGVTAIALLQATVVLVSGEEGRLGRRAFALLPVLFLAWCAAQLVWHRVRLSTLLFPAESHAPAPMDARSWRLLGVVLVGLHVLLLSLPETTTWALQMLSEPDVALTPAYTVSALLDTVLAGVVLAQREAVVDRLFPEGGDGVTEP